MDYFLFGKTSGTFPQISKRQSEVFSDQNCLLFTNRKNDLKHLDVNMLVREIQGKCKMEDDSFLKRPSCNAVTFLCYLKPYY